MIAEADAWAAAGIADMLDPYVRDPQAFTLAEVAALMRAAYGVGYVSAFDDDETDDVACSGCAMAEALRLSLPIR